MKENFYIFLDIDGVLYDMEFCKKGRNKKGGIIKEFKGESMSALNHLINKLEEQYEVKLVISSTWRLNLERTETILKANGLKYDNPILSTPLTSHPEERGKEIMMFLNSEGIDAKGNFVIIDDEGFDYDHYFDSGKIIKTNFANDALSLRAVKKYLGLLEAYENNLNN